MNALCRGLVRTARVKRSIPSLLTIRFNSALTARNEYDALLQSSPDNDQMPTTLAISSRADVKPMLEALDSLMPKLDPKTATETFARVLHDVFEMRMFALSTSLINWFIHNETTAVPMRSCLASWHILMQEVSRARGIGHQQLLLMNQILQGLLTETQAGRVVDHRLLDSRSSAEAIVHFFGAKPWLLPSESIFAFETLCEMWNSPSLPSRARALISAYGRSNQDVKAKHWLETVEKHHTDQGRQQYAGILIARTIYWASPQHSTSNAMAQLANLTETIEPDISRKVQLYTLQSLLSVSARDNSISSDWLREMLGVITEHFRDELSSDWHATMLADVMVGLVVRKDYQSSHRILAKCCRGPTRCRDQAPHAYCCSASLFKGRSD